MADSSAEARLFREDVHGLLRETSTFFGAVDIPGEAELNAAIKTFLTGQELFSLAGEEPKVLGLPRNAEDLEPERFSLKGAGMGYGGGLGYTACHKINDAYKLVDVFGSWVAVRLFVCVGVRPRPTDQPPDRPPTPSLPQMSVRGVVDSDVSLAMDLVFEGKRSLEGICLQGATKSRERNREAHVPKKYYVEEMGWLMKPAMRELWAYTLDRHVQGDNVFKSTDAMADCIKVTDVIGCGTTWHWPVALGRWPCDAPEF